MAHRYAIIVAGGRGLRMGADLPKQFLPLRGEPVLMHTLRQFAPEVEELILVLPAEQQDLWQELCAEHHFTLPHRITTGGATRFDSVRSGLSKLPAEGLVAVHDGVRPLVSRTLIRRTFEVAEETGAALPACPVTDSLRFLGEETRTRQSIEPATVRYRPRRPSTSSAYIAPMSSPSARSSPTTLRSTKLLASALSRWSKAKRRISSSPHRETSSWLISSWTNPAREGQALRWLRTSSSPH